MSIFFRVDATSAQTFIAQESIAAERRNTVNGWTGGAGDAGKESEGKIYTEDNISGHGILPGVQPRRVGDKEREKERKRDASGLFLA